MRFIEYKKEVVRQLEEYFKCEIYSDVYMFGQNNESGKIKVCLMDRNNFKMVFDLKDNYNRILFQLNGKIDAYSLRKEVKIIIRNIEESYLDNTIRRK